MKKAISVLLSACMLVLMVGCGAKEQSATYELVQEEEGMYVMSDVQTLNAKGDKIYEILETTTMEFADVDEATLEMLLQYYDETVEAMKAEAPEGAEVSSSYEGNVYTLTMNLNLENADLQELVAGGYLMGLDDSEDLDKVTFISFKQTCEGLEAAGYTKK